MACLKIEKMRKTMLEKYGTDNAGNIPQFVEKAKKTNQQLYGGNSPACDPKVVDKMRKTCLERYGVEFATLIPEVRQAAWDAYVVKCGKDNIVSPENQEKRIKAILEKYGTLNLMSIPELKAKQQEGMMKSLGVKGNFCFKEVRDHAKATILKKYGVEYPLQSVEIRNRSKKYPNKQEKFVKELFPEIDYNFALRVNVKTGQYKFPDFLVTPFPESKKVVEFFGNFWHSKKNTGLSEVDHEKEITNLYKSVGIDCFIIWYHELKDIKSLIQKFGKFIQQP